MLEPYRLLRRKRTVVGRRALAGYVVGSTGLTGLIWLAFGLSSAFPPLAPIGLPIVVLGALIGTFAVITIIGVGVGMLIY